MSKQYLLILFFSCVALSVSSSEFKYTKPVKARIIVSTTDKEYCITGIFEREKKFPAAYNRERERKYVRLFAEDALRRYLRGKENADSISFSGADITSNLATAKPDEKISFRYTIPFSACKISYRKESFVSKNIPPEMTPSATTKTSTVSDTGGSPADVPKTVGAPTANNPSDSVQVKSEGRILKENNNSVISKPEEQKNTAKEDDLSEISFEIASPQSIFDSSWEITTEMNSKSQQKLDRIVSGFEKQKATIIKSE